MPGGLIMPNAYLDVARPRYTVNTGVTGLPQPYLARVSAAIGPAYASDWAALGGFSEALAVSHVANIAAGVDVASGDTITAVYLRDGVTPWSGFGPQAGQPGSGGVVWAVKFHLDSPAGFLAYRSLYLEKIVLTGPAGLG